MSQFRLRRRFGNRYLTAGRSGGRLPLEHIEHLTDRERTKIERLSHRLEWIAVLDESMPIIGHYALSGIYALDASEALNPWGEIVMPAELCVAYPIRFFVERGEWVEPAEWFKRQDYDGPAPLSHILDLKQVQERFENPSWDF